MKKYLLIAGLFIALLPSPVLAQDAAVEERPVSVAEMKQRIQLATDFADIRPVREQINIDIKNMSARLPEAEREDFMRYVQLRMPYDKIEALSIQTMAKLFTVPELKAMLSYYGSPEGKSADAKVPSYTAVIAPEVAKNIDAAVMDAKLGPQ